SSQSMLSRTLDDFDDDGDIKAVSDRYHIDIDCAAAGLGSSSNTAASSSSRRSSPPASPSSSSPQFSSGNEFSATSGSQDFLLPESAGPNFSFAGCGFMGVYHVGVCSCLKEYAPQLYTNRVLAGASAGALAACCLMCDCDLGQCANFVLSLVDRASVRTLGPFHPSFSITSLLKSGLEDILPIDAHRICSGRLFVSVTDVLTLRNRVISDFPTRDYLIQSLMCSAHIPGFSGLTFPELNGVRLMDGCFSCNLPRLNSQTVLVSPFAGLADISPEDEVWFMMPQPSSIDMDITLANWRRLVRVLWPPGPDRLAQICQRGFDDCVDYLVRHGHVRLSASLEYELGGSGSIGSVGIEASGSADGDCFNSTSYDGYEDDYKALEMRTQLAEGLQNSLPPPVLEALQRAKQKTLLRRLYDSQMVRVVRLLIQPYTLPIDVLYLLCRRLLRYLPSLSGTAQSVLDETRQHLKSFTENVRLRRAQSSALLDRFKHTVIGRHAYDDSYEADGEDANDEAAPNVDSASGSAESNGPRWHRHRLRAKLNQLHHQQHRSAGDLRELLSEELDYRPGEEEAHDTVEQAVLVHQQRNNRLVKFYLGRERDRVDPH
ncbi:hypothetical protein BOX15_Mlig023396g2, partial [Macrostomum lignano]